MNWFKKFFQYHLPAPFTVFTILFLALSLSVTKSHANSKATQWLMEDAVKRVCETKDGKFTSAGVIEADLTGDGRPDLVLDHGGIECSDGSRALTCGIRACSILFYVREGDLLVEKTEILSIGASLGKGMPPTINLMGHNFEESSVRWNGRSFD